MALPNSNNGAIAPAPGKGNPEGYSGLDKQGLWGWWKAGVDEQQDLYMRLVERSFDMPPKPMGLNAPQTHSTTNGINGWQAAAIILTSLLGVGGLTGLGLGGLALLADRQAPQAQVLPVEGVQGAAQVELLDQDGNVLEIEKWPGQ